MAGSHWSRRDSNAARTELPGQWDEAGRKSPQRRAHFVAACKSRVPSGGRHWAESSCKGNEEGRGQKGGVERERTL